MSRSLQHPVGAYLRARRHRLAPAAVGYPTDLHRRVSGLRREEVAVLAGVSVDYYVRLEQGRVPHPSASVLEALAGALLLDELERQHLHRLVAPPPTVAARTVPGARQHLRSEVQHLLDAMAHVPVLVVGRRTEVVAATALGAALYADLVHLPIPRRSLAWAVFLDPSTRGLLTDWVSRARDLVGVLRREADLHPDDRGLAALVGELCVKDATFRTWWDEYPVHVDGSGEERFQHPVVGSLTLHCETLRVSGDDDLSFLVHTAPAGSRDADALALLGAWTTSATSPEPLGTAG